MLEALPQQPTDPAFGSAERRQQQHSNSTNRKPSVQHALVGYGHDCQADTSQNMHQHQQQQPHSPRQRPLQEVAAGRSPSHQRYASQAVLLQAPQLLLLPARGSRQAKPAAGSSSSSSSIANTGSSTGSSSCSSSGLLQQGVPVRLEAPSAGSAAGAAGVGPRDLMQVSIHSMGADMLLQEVRRAFPDSPRLAPLLAVVTFQFCGAARDRMLNKLLQQQQGTGQQHLQQQHSQQRRQPLLLPAPPATQQQQHTVGRGSSSSSDEDTLQARPSCCTPCASAGSAGCEGGGTGSGGGSSSSLQGLCADADMQHMLEVFMAWQQAVYDHITSRGYWCDTIDPRTGTALHSTPGSHYDEVIGASVLLGYDQVTPQGQTLALISHPDAATQVYPATLFTSAPLPVLREALRAASGGNQGTVRAVPSPAAATAATVVGTSSQPPQQQQQQQQPHSPQLDLPCARVQQLPQLLQPATQQQQEQQQQQQELLLSCSGVSLRTPAGVPVVQGLTLQVPAGGSLLIQGPSGCGKSTFLSCLAGLWPLDSGSISLVGGQQGGAAGGVAGSAGAAAGVMFVPQRPLAAPGITLRQQLLYPAAASLWPCCCSTITSSSSSNNDTCRAGGGSQAQQAACKGRRQQQWGVSRSWWLNWLSCGLHQQQLHAASPAQHTPARPHPLMSEKQQQLSLPALPPPAQPLLWQQLQGQQQQQQGLVGVCPSCQHLVSILHCVGLSYLLSAHPMGLHSRHEAWGDVLSPGELQRLSFARLLLHKPRLAVLDEATSALPDAAAVELYQQLQRAGVSYVSVGHSRCLVGVHTQVLTVVGDGSGGWQLS